MKKRKPTPKPRRKVKPRARPRKRRLSQAKRNIKRRAAYAAAKLKPRKKKRRLSRSKVNIKRRIRRDKRRVFKTVPYRDPGEGSKHTFQEENFEDRLAREPKQEPEQQWQWTDEDAFIAQVLAMGLTEREAYTLWFS